MKNGVNDNVTKIAVIVTPTARVTFSCHLNCPLINVNAELSSYLYANIVECRKSTGDLSSVLFFAVNKTRSGHKNGNHVCLSLCACKTAIARIRFVGHKFSPGHGDWPGTLFNTHLRRTRGTPLPLGSANFIVRSPIIVQ